MPYKSPTRCAEPGCGEIAVNLGRCGDHQRKAWENRAPREERYSMSGSAWQKLRLEILKRDEYVCYVCHLGGADEVDHIVPVAEGGAKQAGGNLGAIHASPCHEDKSAAEKARSRERARARRAYERDPEGNPPPVPPGRRDAS